MEVIDWLIDDCLPAGSLVYLLKVNLGVTFLRGFNWLYNSLWADGVKDGNYIALHCIAFDPDRKIHHLQGQMPRLFLADDLEPFAV